MVPECYRNKAALLLHLSKQHTWVPNEYRLNRKTCPGIQSVLTLIKNKVPPPTDIFFDVIFSGLCIFVHCGIFGSVRYRPLWPCQDCGVVHFDLFRSVVSFSLAFLTYVPLWSLWYEYKASSISRAILAHYTWLPISIRSTHYRCVDDCPSLTSMIIHLAALEILAKGPRVCKHPIDPIDTPVCNPFFC